MAPFKKNREGVSGQCYIGILFRDAADAEKKRHLCLYRYAYRSCQLQLTVGMTGCRAQRIHADIPAAIYNCSGNPDILMNVTKSRVEDAGSRLPEVDAMSIEIHCTSCGRTLQVAEEHAGKQARCPVCHSIYNIPGERPATQPTGTESEAWFMRTPEGHSYGPVDKAGLDAWVAEGRVTWDCEIRSAGGNWEPSVHFFPHLQPAPAATSPVAQPAIEPVSPFREASRSQVYQAAHRGGLILALGIVCWVMSCPIFSIMAWVMGTSDLREMDLGRMDAAGRGLTQAGRILGMVYSMIWIISMVIFVFITLFVAIQR